MSSPASAFDDSAQEDEYLVRQCLKANASAWERLIDKYKSLIFSIPVKQGFSPEDADEIFQAVCLALLTDLPRLREPRALAAWLIRTTLHKCAYRRDEHERFVDLESHEFRLSGNPEEAPEELLRQCEREQMLREALTGLPDNCSKLIQQLFFATPPVPYELAAEQLKLAKGSIGATRKRCLERLRRALEKKGWN
jgi:RNA polymerase sigma factor (sigma-70 family)